MAVATAALARSSLTPPPAFPAGFPPAVPGPFALPGLSEPPLAWSGLPAASRPSGGLPRPAALAYEGPALRDRLGAPVRSLGGVSGCCCAARGGGNDAFSWYCGWCACSALSRPWSALRPGPVALAGCCGAPRTRPCRARGASGVACGWWCSPAARAGAPAISARPTSSARPARCADDSAGSVARPAAGAARAD